MKASTICLKKDTCCEAQAFIKPVVPYLESLTHMAEQSKLTSIHLCGLKLKLSASLTPSSSSRNSGQMNELPAYAASM